MRGRSVGDAVTIAIRDSGIGIPREALPKIGRPFEQVESQLTKTTTAPGSALPSPSRWSNCTAGAMRIVSAAAQGTIVAVRLPARGPAAPRGLQASAGAGGDEPELPLSEP